MNGALLNEHRWGKEDDPRKIVISPQWLVERIRNEVFGAPIDLDPATTPQNPVGALRNVTPPENGLFVKWSGRVFLNPPWGATIGHWIERAVLVGGGRCKVVVLAPSRTDARWYQRALASCTDALVFGKRLDHERPMQRERRVRGATGGLMASTLFGFGISVKTLGDLGVVVRPQVTVGERRTVRRAIEHELGPLFEAHA